MYVREVKRKCDVRGCNNINCYSISRTREFGNTVIICKSCLGQALGALDEIKPETHSNMPENKTSIPPLFFNAAALGTDMVACENEVIEDETPDEIVPAEKLETDSQTNMTTQAISYVCSTCGKHFASKRALQAHEKRCNANGDK